MKDGGIVVIGNNGQSGSFGIDGGEEITGNVVGLGTKQLSVTDTTTATIIYNSTGPFTFIAEAGHNYHISGGLVSPEPEP